MNAFSSCRYVGHGCLILILSLLHECLNDLENSFLRLLYINGEKTESDRSRFTVSFIAQPPESVSACTAMLSLHGFTLKLSSEVNRAASPTRDGLPWDPTKGLCLRQIFFVNLYFDVGMVVST